MNDDLRYQILCCCSESNMMVNADMQITNCDLRKYSLNTIQWDLKC